MARFTARVELHGLPESEYRDLHRFMEAQGFSRRILSAGRSYHLPHAEYIIDTNRTGVDILEMASNAATKTGHRFGVLVTGPDGWQIRGLVPVQQAAAS